jgi:hypothetical protein
MSKYLRIMGLSVSLALIVAVLNVTLAMHVMGQPPTTCPCNFFAVPMIPECWLEPFPMAPQYGTIATPLQICGTFNDTEEFFGPLIDLNVLDDDDDGICSIDILQIPDCPATPQPNVPISTEEQVHACICDLLEYTRRLNQELGGIVSGAPFICSADLECTSPIPTLSQWWMMIMAGVLGLFMIIVIIIKRKSAVVNPRN